MHGHAQDQNTCTICVRMMCQIVKSIRHRQAACRDRERHSALAEKPNTMDGHVIEVKGYASSAGVCLNQKLSEDRANNATKVVV